MKRPMSPTLSLYQAISNNDHGCLKRQRTDLQNSPIAAPIVIKKSNKTSSSSSLRVRFADPLAREQVRMIPSLDEDVKRRLFYTNCDFARFAFHERLRRDALILTVAVCREQLKRMRRSAPVISPSSVTMMYHKVLSRTEDETLKRQQRQHRHPHQSSANAVMDIVHHQQYHLQSSNKALTQQEPSPTVEDSRRRIVVARAA